MSEVEVGDRVSFSRGGETVNTTGRVVSTKSSTGAVTIRKDGPFGFGSIAFVPRENVKLLEKGDWFMQDFEVGDKVRFTSSGKSVDGEVCEIKTNCGLGGRGQEVTVVLEEDGWLGEAGKKIKIDVPEGGFLEVSKEQKKEESMQFKPGQRVKVVTPVEFFYGKYLGDSKDIAGEYTDAKIETDKGKGRNDRRTVRVKKKFVHPVEEEEPTRRIGRKEVAAELGRKYSLSGPIANDWLDDILSKRGNREVRVEAGYDSLFDVLIEALDQAQRGKGKSQHGNDLDFTEQEICETTRAVGLGFPLGQSRKKCRESLRILEQKGPEAARQELFGAIVYIAAACLLLDEKKD